MTAGKDFIERGGSAVSVHNYHFKCSPLPTQGLARARSRLLVLLHRVVPVRGSREIASQVWALLFSLFLSVSPTRFLLARRLFV